MMEYGLTEEVILFVTYQGRRGSRFDRGYYLEKHLPLLREIWTPLGLTSVEALFPATEETGTIALCECRFRDEAAIAACYASPNMPSLAADIGVFTDIMPLQLRASRV